MGEDSIPVKLRCERSLDVEKVKEVMESLDYAIEYYADRDMIPKKLAISMVDIFTLFSFREGYFDEKTISEIENIGIELQEKAYKLFS